MAKDEVILLGCGDVGPFHEPVDKYSTLVRSTLATGNIRFAQCERVYSERGSLQVQAGFVYAEPDSPVESRGAQFQLKPHMASVFGDCGFNVVSMAGNHAMDWGPDAMLDTIELL